ncbi:MAG: hypothetical protein EAZ06_10650 [Cytophagales bacterium]|nr:MAG: hypothetical protein EAZ06_10650 [Cytophagales bacterium]
MKILRLKFIFLHFCILYTMFSCQSESNNKIISYGKYDINNYNFIDETDILVWNFDKKTITINAKNTKVISFEMNKKNNILLSDKGISKLYYDFFTNKIYNFENEEYRFFFTPTNIQLKDSIVIKYHNKNHCIYKFHCNKNIDDGVVYHYFLKGWGVILYQSYGVAKYSNWIPISIKNSNLGIDEIIGIIKILKNNNFIIHQSPPKAPYIE